MVVPTVTLTGWIWGIPWALTKLVSKPKSSRKMAISFVFVWAIVI